MHVARSNELLVECIQPFQWQVTSNGLFLFVCREIQYVVLSNVAAITTKRKVGGIHLHLQLMLETFHIFKIFEYMLTRPQTKMQLGLKTKKMCKCFHLQALCSGSINLYATEVLLNFFQHIAHYGMTGNFYPSR